jgi:hypothetical protein
MALPLFELRGRAGVTLQRAADWLGKSWSHVRNCERGLATLTVEEEESLRAFYAAQIVENMERLVTSLTDNEISSEK